jgi:ribosomal protein S18 acetylase RimI-like enzyme
MAKDNSKQGLLKRQGLTSAELAKIEGLASLCNTHEGLDLKLIWSALRTRPHDRTNDFLYYENGMLVGFAGLFNFNPKEAEINGMVHPDYRRRGIFTALFNAAREVCPRRGITKILMIVERVSRSGLAFASAMHARYDHSEYKMKLEGPRFPARFDPRLQLRLARAEDSAILAHIIAISFDLLEHEVSVASEIDNPLRRCYVAQLDDAVIGTISVSLDGREAYIYGFGILPEYRGRGYGRQTLARTVQEILATGQERIALEVEVQNKSALTLYESCGFKEAGCYDYYALDV